MVLEVLFSLSAFCLMPWCRWDTVSQGRPHSPGLLGTASGFIVSFTAVSQRCNASTCLYPRKRRSVTTPDLTRNASVELLLWMTWHSNSQILIQVLNDMNQFSRGFSKANHGVHCRMISQNQQRLSKVGCSIHGTVPTFAEAWKYGWCMTFPS
jgi:hypothetical protein